MLLQDVGPSGTVKLQRTQRSRDKASTPSEALAALMDFPHPLEILADPRSYGPDGAISRYHDPENYCIVLGGIIGARTRDWRASLAQQSEHSQVCNDKASFQDSTATSATPSAMAEAGRSCSEEHAHSILQAGNHAEADASAAAEGPDPVPGAPQAATGSFLSSVPRLSLPWFKRLTEEEGTAVIKVGRRDPAGSQSAAPRMAAEATSHKPVISKTKLPELHKIHVPSRRS